MIPIQDLTVKKLAVITADTDWVPEEVLEDTHDYLCSLGVPITYFVTQDYATLKRDAPVAIELAPHPNFNTTLDLEGELLRCLAFVPGAQSYRAHSCLWSERLRPILKKHGIRFSSSAMRYLQPNLSVYDIAHGITEAPLYWMDMFHMEYCSLAGRPLFDVEALGLESPGLKVFDVHPVHLFLNTQSLEHYAESKEYYQMAAELRRRRRDGSGIRDMFTKTVLRLQELRYEFCLLREAHRAVVA